MIVIKSKKKGKTQISRYGEMKRKNIRRVF